MFLYIFSSARQLFGKIFILNFFLCQNALDTFYIWGRVVENEDDITTNYWVFITEAPQQPLSSFYTCRNKVSQKLTCLRQWGSQNSEKKKLRENEKKQCT